MTTRRNEKPRGLHYYEATIYLQEGENNDKFTVYPRDPARYPAYLIVHSTWFHILNFVASISLLILTIFEPPSFPFLQLPVFVHGILEITALFVIFTDLVLKLKWLGLKNFITHKRTMLKVILLIIMMAEAITLLVRQSSHFRVTRSLRPLFLLDSFYCRNIRRFIRQILQSLPAILNILTLLMFFMVTFAILGFYLFSSNPRDTYFQTFSDSFISLFILMTTANFPDVMMPSYKASKWSALFFIVYIGIEIFLFMNLFLAVVYSAFLKAEKDKFKKLFLHKRNGCKLAFQLLISDEHPDCISFEHFAGCMTYYRPRLSIREVYLFFKSLNDSGTGLLTLDEFMNVYDYSKFQWKEDKQVNMVNDFNYWNKTRFRIFKIVSNKWFDYTVYFVIFANLIWILFDTIRISVLKSQYSQPSFDWIQEESRLYGVSVMFVLIYIVEAIMKIIGFGIARYFSSGWNIFDFLVTVMALIGVLLQLVNNNFYYIIIVRPLRVLRLFKVTKSFRDIFGSLFILIPRISSLGVVMLILFYFFAIIGMEIFAPYSDRLMNCCVNTSVQQFYAHNNESNIDGYYYLCTFENLLVSGVTLFELTVVNNWWIIMEGYASVVSPWTQIYFMVFYLVTMVVMTVVVAFILETYLFRDKCKQDIEDHSFQKIVLSLTPEELAELNTSPLHESISTSDNVHFEGIRRLNKSDFNLRMYNSEIQAWLTESL